jgi:uncharacterized protein YjbI with pentapeptide repeats
MANQEHLAKLRKGARIWNQWRSDNPKVIPDLKKAHLYQAHLSNFNLRDAMMPNAVLDKSFLRHTDMIGAQLGGASLKHADCRSLDGRGISFRGAQLDEANFEGANLRSSKLDGARLYKTVLAGCNLSKADLRGVKLTGANLQKALLIGADLSNSRLDKSDCSRADFSEANLRNANLQNAIAHGASFRLAILHHANLDSSDITGSHLWEAQRAGWSITNIICKSAFWDEGAKVSSTFTDGEFERLYGNQLVIELFYEGGITPFEVNTLPALLHEVSKLHPDCRLRLASIVETNGGALMTIRVEGAARTEIEGIKADAEALRIAQVELRESRRSNERLEIQKALLLEEVFPKIIQHAGGTVNVLAPTNNLAVGIGGGRAQATQNEGIGEEELGEIIRQIRSEFASLPANSSLAIEIADAIQIAQEAQANCEAKPSIFSNALMAPRDAAVRAAASEGAAAIGAHLPALLQKLEHYISAVAQ